MYKWHNGLWFPRKMLQINKSIKYLSCLGRLIRDTNKLWELNKMYHNTFQRHNCVSSFLTLSQTSPAFYVSAVQVFWKHSGEKEKLLITSNFSFPRSVFYPFFTTFCHFHQIKNRCLLTLSVSKSLKFVIWESVQVHAHDNIFHIWKG